jgi:uncharacterized protein (UPF0332 family)
MTGKDFLDFAKTIHSDDDEATRRSAVSRSYYALFHQVKSIVVSTGIPIKKDASAHIKLVHYLRNAGIPDARFIGSNLQGLREMRNDADYDLNTTKFNKNTCALQYSLAKTSCDKLDSINSKRLNSLC